jgi:hypothetical protein
MKLFYIESRGASDMGRAPGEWHPTQSEADTLAEASALNKKEYAVGWVNTRIVTRADVAEAQRVELEALREEVEFLRKLAVPVRSGDKP